MEKIEKVYKIVRKSPDGSLRSLMTRDPSLEVTYVPGVWTKPKLDGSKLFCYKDIWFARETRRMLMPCLAWECQAKNVRLQSLLISWWSREDIVKKFWKEQGESLGDWGWSVYSDPEIYGCDELKLIRELID